MAKLRKRPAGTRRPAKETTTAQERRFVSAYNATGNIEFARQRSGLDPLTQQDHRELMRAAGIEAANTERMLVAIAASNALEMLDIIMDIARNGDKDADRIRAAQVVLGLVQQKPDALDKDLSELSAEELGRMIAQLQMDQAKRDHLDLPAVDVTGQDAEIIASVFD